MKLIQNNRANSGKKNYLFSRYALIVASMIFSAQSHAQTYLETFGQNRVQLRRFDWKVFETPHFRVHHYDRSGKDLARYVAEQAEQDMALIEQKGKRKVTERFNIVLYNSYDDYRQTNSGRQNDNLIVRSSESGSIDFPENKIVLYFSGVHTDLKNQIREGVAAVLTDKKLHSGSLDNMAVNSALKNIPVWIQDGYASYMAEGWSEQTDKAWRAVTEQFPEKRFYFFTDQSPLLAGMAFWKYVGIRYGKPEIAGLMNGLKAKGNLNKTLKSRYKMNVVAFFDSCLAFYKDAFARDNEGKVVNDPRQAQVMLKAPENNDILIRNLKVSPRGADIAFVRWDKGVFQVRLKHTNSEQEESVILEGGETNHMETADPNYPLMTWSNTGYKLAILYKKGNSTRLRIYDATKGKLATYVVPNNRFDRVLGMSIDEDNDAIIFSAIRKSQTDLYYFTIKGSRMRNITNDVWDDVEPAFVTGGRKRGIAFLSNRPAANLNVPSAVNELPAGPMNMFFYDTKTKSPALLKCSDNKENNNLSRPTQYGTDNFAYISDANGVKNKYVVIFGRDVNNRDSMYWVPATNYAHSLTNHQYNPAGNIVADILREGPSYNVYYSEIKIPGTDYPVPQLKKAILVETPEEAAGMIASDNGQKKDETKKRRRNRNHTTVDNLQQVRLDNGNTFQSEFPAKEEEQTSTAAATEPAAGTDTSAAEDVVIRTADSSFLKMKPQPYRLAFNPASFSISLDNNILFNRYQSASLNGNSFANPTLGGLVTLSMNDLMEDYRVTGGFKLPFGLPGSTYYIQFENVRRRLDWSVAAMRSTTTREFNLQFVDSSGNLLLNTLGFGKISTNLIQGNFSYPFDRMRSLRFQTGFRQDVSHIKAIDTFTLIFPSSKQYWSMSRLEFVFDNSKLITTNIRNGVRYKLFGEYMYQLNDKGGGVYNFGFDFRYYKKIYKNLIWAFRVAGAHSGGKQKILYFLGGVDNWINYQQASMPASIQTDAYGFMAQSNNLRGYKQGARAGNSYSLMNSEFRFPFLSSLIQRPIQSKILRSLQLVAFTDIGMAWFGLFPSEKNMTTTQSYYTYPIQVNVNVPPAETVSLGYGAGLRAAISGYQIRLDAAWNRTGSPKPVIYLSLGTDF
ncbi:hypothetical protein [Rurimicrobium arvi]|uniref:WD40-like Beta Propeller Repeat n=1 Tax=Rurimicrobium arvi TaxID=2049916 RepID=A0ABP8MEG5_9BACT